MNNEQEVHFEGKIAQKVIVVNKDKVLLVQDPRGKKEVWELPGGRMNIDEAPKVAIQREFTEEMGRDIEVGSVVHMEQFIHVNDGSRAFVIVYEATLVRPEEPFEVDDREVSKVHWFSKKEIEKLELYPEYQHALAAYFAK